MSDVIVIELDDAPILIELDADAAVLAVALDAPADVVVDVSAIGVPGVAGPAGVAPAYVHTQSSAATTWTIPHNLGFRPTVSITTTGGLAVIGDVQHLSDNTLVLSFAVALAGTARLV